MTFPDRRNVRRSVVELLKCRLGLACVSWERLSLHHFRAALTLICGSAWGTASLPPPCFLKMETKSQRMKGPDGTLSLNAAIDTLGLARDTTRVKPAKDVFSSANLLLVTIRVRRSGAHVVSLLVDVPRVR